MSARESLIAALRQRGDVARRVSFRTNFYNLPAAAREALDGLAALLENAADEIERLERAHPPGADRSFSL